MTEPRIVRITAERWTSAPDRWRGIVYDYPAALIYPQKSERRILRRCDHRHKLARKATDCAKTMAEAILADMRAGR